ncbi:MULTISPECIES: DNA phosphorothioation system sulfurtransferase DndC [Streptomyces]|uniref:DNA phosphorothioation system sulfurtransferase DndC n=2 Tax=Streptomyces TaxID=1883 RepID=A0ABU2T7C7_9ACTN|nr:MULTISPECIES: DNA phosphorothioation system sulfurtransferase DndC [Streptomyces]MDT0457012.1 DNA phosphorothioation system sulfurtransferase DndC [Streptomyces sp. DSM 41527]WAU04811.1 DNA phosphorothioation system sulfurtransferase DndC [Streptomyces nigrescens]
MSSTIPIPLGLPAQRRRAFNGRSLDEVTAELAGEIRELYTADQVPWVIGYSGGKDSTAVLQLVWTALKELPAEQLTKQVHVISTDTLVENPVVAAWVTNSLETMAKAAGEQGLPIEPHRLTPDVKDTFWVNLIGRGYPAPRPKFRWCTERLKIKPSNSFIRSVVAAHGEAIMVLGIRKTESQARARAMEKHEKRRVRDRLSPNANLPNSLVYSPVEDWTDDDVWEFLMQRPNPWGYNNEDLLSMYQGASADGECPLVVDSTTPSCGSSRFGCWTCTLVEQDKSMSAMIQNDDEKEWMFPLLTLRNKLDAPFGHYEEGDPDLPAGRKAPFPRPDKPARDFRRINGKVMLFNDGAIHGPYKQDYREKWLRELLEAQTWIRTNPDTPEHVRNIALITPDELHEIRRIWVFDKHEVEDTLPRIYQEATGEEFPGGPLDEQLVMGADEMQILKEICGDDELHYSMVRELLSVERKYRTMTRRAGLFKALQQAVEKGYYEDGEDAVAFAKRKKETRVDTAQPLTQTLTFDQENELDAPA